MDPVQFLKCISFFSLDRIIIYWNRLYDLQSLVGLPVWFCWTNWRKQLKGSNACLRTSAATEERSVSGQNLKTNLSYGSKSRGSLATSWPATWSVSRHLRWLMNWTSPASRHPTTGAQDFWHTTILPFTCLVATVATRGEKTVTISTTGHEKSCFTVVLSCLADGKSWSRWSFSSERPNRKRSFHQA